MLESPTFCGFVAFIGLPNAGKSTLLNALVGKNIAIVSHKVQTTRRPVRGILNHGNHQIIFVDTPGIFSAQRVRERTLVQNAWEAAQQADIAAFLVDSLRGLTEEIRHLFQQMNSLPQIKLLILTKIDLAPPIKLLALAEELNRQQNFAATFMVSARTGSGLDSMTTGLSKFLKESPFLYPEEYVSDTPFASLAEDITREKIFLRCHEELPYESSVETLSWENKSNGSARIEQAIYVVRESHKKILIGEGGQTLKAIGIAARKAIQELTGQEIHLFLSVKIKKEKALAIKNYG